MRALLSGEGQDQTNVQIAHKAISVDGEVGSDNEHDDGRGGHSIDDCPSRAALVPCWSLLFSDGLGKQSIKKTAALPGSIVASEHSLGQPCDKLENPI